MSADFSFSILVLSAAPNERMAIPGGTSLTLVSCTERHNTNLAHLMSLGKLKEVKRAESLADFTIRLPALDCIADNQATAVKQACVSDCSFVSNE